MCRDLSTCTLGVTYERAAPTQSTDRDCQPVRECTVGLYSTAEPTVSTDRVCADCNRACASNEYESTACTPTSNRQCFRITPPCDTRLEYEAQAPNATHDRVCNQISDCTPSEFETGAPTSTSDRACQAVAVCDPAVQFELEPPTSTTNRICSNFTNCGPTEWASFFGNETSDRVCDQLTACFPRFEYESAGPTATSDRECTPLVTCTSPFSFESVPPTPTSQRLCQPVTQCRSPVEYEVSPATPTTDSVCGIVSPCPIGQYILQNATTSSNTVCTHCTRCPGRAADVHFVIDCRDRTQNGPCFDQLRFAQQYVQQNPVETGSLAASVVAYDTSGAHELLSTQGSVDILTSLLNGTTNLPPSFTNQPETPIVDALLLVAARLSSQIPSGREVHVLIFSGNSIVSSTGQTAILNASSSLSVRSEVTLYVQQFGSALLHPTDADYWDSIASSPSSLMSPLSTSQLLTSRVQTFSDAVCPEACPADTFRSAVCSAFADRVCSTATSCSPGVQFETLAPTLVNDRFCSFLTFCNGTEFESVAPTATTDRVCSPITECSAAEFRSLDATLTSDTVCNVTRVCGQIEFQVAAPTSTTDRICQETTICDAQTQFVRSAATSSTDTQCVNATPPCNIATEFELRPLARSSDRVCQAIATCESAEFEQQSPTNVSNRICNGCQRCYGDAAHFIFVLSLSPSIVDPAQGGSIGSFGILLDAIRSTVRQAPVSSGLGSNATSRYSVLTYGASAQASWVTQLQSVENVSSLAVLNRISPPSIANGGTSDISPALQALETTISGNVDFAADRTVVIFLTDGILLADPPAFVTGTALGDVRDRRVFAVGTANQVPGSVEEARLIMLSSSGQ